MCRFFTIAITLVLGVVGCTRKGAGPAGADAGPAVVTVAVPQKKTVRWTVEQPGTVQAFEMTSLVAKLPGFVKHVHVDIDDVIQGPSADGKTGGTLLAEIAMPEVEEEGKQKIAQADQARAEVELARKNLVALEAAVTTARATIREAQAREKSAKSGYDRWKGESARVDDLVARKVIDKQTGEETLNQARAAEGMWEEARAHTAAADAGLKEADAKRDRAGAEVTAAIARAAAAAADARRAAALLEYAQVRAPYAGIVTGRFVHTGTFLQPGAGKVEALFSVARTDKVRIVVEVPEVAASRVQKGTKVKVRVSGLRAAEFDGEIARTSWALNPEVRTLRAEIDLPNPDRKLRPGTYAYATIPLEQADALVIPTTAIAYQDDSAYCFLFADGKAVRYQLHIGQPDGDGIEVIRRKKAGPRESWQPWDGREQVIIAHQGPLMDGAKAEVKK